MSSVVDRFLRYIQIDTQSDHFSESCPSTAKQMVLAHLLEEECRKLGLQDVSMDQNGYVMATLPANTQRTAPTIGLIAHMDTSPDMSGENVKPRFIEDYDGGDITLNPEKKVVLSPVDFPELEKYKGQTLIVTDGTTLLGADDKAGIAEILAAVEYLTQHPEVEHGTLKIGFTPDEEVGRGTEAFDVKKFGADFAYTMDGGELGELEYENFNAAGVTVKVHGRNVHPGTAKDKMINSMLIAMELNDMLPVHQRPDATEKYEGFFHLTDFTGVVEETTTRYIIRDHDRKKFEDKKALILRAGEFLNGKYGKGVVDVQVEDQYQNMKELIVPVMHIVDLAKEAMLDLGIQPLIIPIRGGTDGARLTYEGLPCPNIFNGSHNCHGKYEYIPVASMEKAVDVILKIVEKSLK